MKTENNFPINKFKSYNNSILKGLSLTLFNNIESLMIDKKYKKGQSVFIEGSYPAGVFYLKEGMVKKYKTDNRGNEHILYLCSKDELLGFSALMCNETYSDSASALVPCTLGFISKDDFMKITSESNELLMRLLSSLGHEYGVLVNSVTVFAQMSVRERLALTLLILSDKFKINDDPGYGEIKLSREELANMVGTAVETIVRFLSEFKKENLIEINGKTIILQNPKELAVISKFY
jgi:CRP-like cAMP-binding protein